jgi:beta-lactamase class D
MASFHLLTRTALAAGVAALALAGCGRVKAPAGTPGAPEAFDKARLEAAIDSKFGGIGACVVIADTASGRQLYRYGSHQVCMRQLPPCSTFKIPNSLIGLDAGVVTPTTVLKWDGTPQRVSAWEHDADMRTAFKQSIVWWYQRVARQIGKPAYEERLKAFDYGDHEPDGPVDRFWLGPSPGAQGLLISTEQQVDFLHRLYGGKLPVKPASAAFVKSIMVDETRGSSVMSGKTGTCPTDLRQSRQVGWWVGRLQSPPHDYLFAVSLEGANDESLPGGELSERVKSAFAAAGLWPYEAAASDAAAPESSAAVKGRTTGSARTGR